MWFPSDEIHYMYVRCSQLGYMDMQYVEIEHFEFLEYGFTSVGEGSG